MLLKAVTVENFRCIKKATVQCENLTALVGRNGSGKSTILRAIDTFFSVRAAISEQDFYGLDTTEAIRITGEFRDLSAEERSEFSPYLSDDTLAVTKEIAVREGGVSQRYYAKTRQIRKIAGIRALSQVTEKRNAWNQLIDSGDLPDLGPRSIRGDNPDELMLEYERAHPELTEWIAHEVQFFGPPNIGGGKLDHSTKFVFVPAVREATADLVDKKGTPLNQLLDYLVVRRFRARQDVRQIQNDFSERLTQLYSPASLVEYQELAAGISTTLRTYVPSAAFTLQVEAPKLPEIPAPVTISSLAEDGFSGAVDRKGHGVQRALIFAMLQHLAVAKPIEGDDAGNTMPSAQEVPASQLDETAPSASVPDLIIAIEEPELYQHPLRAKHLARVLRNMAQQSHLSSGGRYQVIYCTHSPYFVGMDRFDEIRVVRKQNQPECAPCSDVAAYSLLECAQRLEELTGSTPGSFTPESFRGRAYPIMTHTVSEGFFADAVVLVEGLTETAALRTVAHIKQQDWLSTGIAIIPVDGKSKFDRPTVIFRGLGIPTYILFDGDSSCRGANREQERIRLNRLLLRLNGACEEDFPGTCVADLYACFECNFEHYCQDAIGEVSYQQLLERAAAAHGYTRTSDALKNYDVVVDFVTGVYAANHTLPMLEQIVERVTALVADTALHSQAEMILA